jgi:hypothetical protein
MDHEGWDTRHLVAVGIALYCLGFAAFGRLSRWVVEHWPCRQILGDDAPSPHHWVIAAFYKGVTENMVVRQACTHCHQRRMKIIEKKARV